ncbi:hypothetical protein KCU64_g46, partial [Aureobasidium melanogenum]
LRILWTSREVLSSSTTSGYLLRFSSMASIFNQLLKPLQRRHKGPIASLYTSNLHIDLLVGRGKGFLALLGVEIDFVLDQFHQAQHCALFGAYFQFLIDVRRQVGTMEKEVASETNNAVWQRDSWPCKRYVALISTTDFGREAPEVTCLAEMIISKKSMTAARGGVLEDDGAKVSSRSERTGERLRESARPSCHLLQMTWRTGLAVKYKMSRQAPPAPLDLSFTAYDTVLAVCHSDELFGKLYFEHLFPRAEATPASLSARNTSISRISSDALFRHSQGRLCGRT